MTKAEAEAAASVFRNCRWDVEVDDKIGGLRNPNGYALKGRAAKGDGWVYGFSHNDMKVLVINGQVASLTALESTYQENRT